MADMVDTFPELDPALARQLMARNAAMAAMQPQLPGGAPAPVGPATPGDGSPAAVDAMNAATQTPAPAFMGPLTAAQQAASGPATPPLPAPSRISGYTGDMPGMPRISNGAPVPPGVAAHFAGRGGYISPIRADSGDVVGNANGVLASRELPGRRLSEAEYNSLPRDPNQSFPTYQALQSGGAALPAVAGASPVMSFEAFARQARDVAAASGANIAVTPQAYDTYVQRMNQQSNAQQQLELERARTLGMPGVAGSVRNAADLAQSQVAANGIERQRDAQQAAAYNQFVQQRVANGGSIGDAHREWTSSGRPVPAFATNAPPVPRSVTTAAGGETNPPPTVPQQSPDERLNQVFQSIQQRQSGTGPNQSATAKIVKPHEGITDFINTLGEDFVGRHTPEVMRFVIDRFGADTADDWFTHRSSIVGKSSPQEDAIRMIQRAANARVPGTVGNSRVNEETGGPAGFMPRGSFPSADELRARIRASGL